MPNIFAETAVVQATCDNGLAPYLADELAGLGFPARRTHRNGVEISATGADCMRLCLSSRIAYTFLYQLLDFPCRNADTLYRTCAAYPWEEVIAPEAEISVTCRVNTPSVNDTRYPVLKLKDAIVDRLREKRGARPNSSNERNGAVIHLNWQEGHAWVFLNTAGQKLSDRGYRRSPGGAPLRETLAAAILQAMGYDGTQPLVNPMCGSGTLAIEAALIMRRCAPGLLRDRYGFQHLQGYSPEAYLQQRQALTKAKKNSGYPPIIASDISPDAVATARRNAATAGVDNLIKFQVGDFRETVVPAENSAIVLNPPYGERLGEVQELESLYKAIGDWFKQKCQGCTGYVFTGNRELGKKVGLHPDRRFEFFNAKIECRLFRYGIYAGRG